MAALLHQLPTQALRRMRLLVRPDTVLRWHRDVVARRHAAQSRPKRGGRPRTVHSIRAPVLRLARENPNWGYRRLHGELLVLGVKVATPTVWEILKEAGIPPAPERASSTWADFLRSQADALLACDFFETVTLSGVRVPRMNSIMERWVQTCRRELLDRTLIGNQRHLLHALREFEYFYNQHRPNQGIANARPMHPLPQPITDLEKMNHLGIRRLERLGELLHKYQHAA
ncbi:hypothetical protein GCM10009753_05040 [Streptantibioticus ferralitis]